MKDKGGSKWLVWLIVAVVIVIIGVGIYYLIGPRSMIKGAEYGSQIGVGEDSWIKDEKGVYVKHGNPSETPSEVVEQQKVIDCAQKLYYEWQKAGMVFESQCLGDCVHKYAVDIVHVPRTAEDDKPENQCPNYRSGLYTNFVELDKDGKIVKIS